MAAPRTNQRGLVIEMVLPGRETHHPARALLQAVLFDGTLLERTTTKAQRRKHWRAAHYGKGQVARLDVLDSTSWLGRWVGDHERAGYTLYGVPFLVEANQAEVETIESGEMPRALAIRLAKARAEVGVVSGPWGDE
jgi:hypothetical protein